MLKIHMLEQVVNTENVCENAQELSPKRKVPHGIASGINNSSGMSGGIGGSSSSNGGSAKSTPTVSATSSPHHQPTPPQRHIHATAGGKSVSQGSSPAG
ncbi:GL18865 [Drosophila persimilis]|nr:GL18865 [Drosophila persimilis]